MVQGVVGIVDVEVSLEGDVAKGDAITRKEGFRCSLKNYIMPKCDIHFSHSNSLLSYGFKELSLWDRVVISLEQIGKV